MEQLERIAIERCAELFPDDDWVLFEGVSSAAGPHRVLVGPEPLRTKGTILYEEAERLLWYNKRKNWRRMDEISEEWDKLMADCIK